MALLARAVALAVAYDVVFTYHNRSAAVIKRQATMNNGHPAIIDPDFFDVALAAAATHLTGTDAIYIVVDYLDEIAIPLPKNAHVVLSHTLYPSGTNGRWPFFSSSAKEAYMHAIPALNSSFLYLNDDMIVTHPLSPHYFFRAEGTVYTLVGPEHKHMPWWSAVFDTAHIGSKPSTQYTATHLFPKKSKHAKALVARALYPSHAPRPYDVAFIKSINRSVPHLWDTVLDTKFRCTHCINTNSLMVAASLLRPKKFKTIPAHRHTAQTKFTRCPDFATLARTFDFITVQEATPATADCIRAWWKTQPLAKQTKRHHSTH